MLHFFLWKFSWINIQFFYLHSSSGAFLKSSLNANSMYIIKQCKVCKESETSRALDVVVMDSFTNSSIFTLPGQISANIM